jgi:hypothetical protein
MRLITVFNLSHNAPITSQKQYYIDELLTY